MDANPISPPSTSAPRVGAERGRRPSFTCARSAVRAERGGGGRDGRVLVTLVVYRPLGGGLPIGIERRIGPDGERVDLLVPEIRL